MTFLKMRDDASQEPPSMIRACQPPCFLIHALEWCPILILRSLLIKSFLLFLLLRSVTFLLYPPSQPESLITISGLFVFLPKPLIQLSLTLFLPKVLSDMVSPKFGEKHAQAHTVPEGL